MPYTLPPGVVVPPGTVLPPGTILPPGSGLVPGQPLPAETVLPPGTVLPAGTALPSGTKIPAGSVVPVHGTAIQTPTRYPQAAAPKSGSASPDVTSRWYPINRADAGDDSLPARISASPYTPMVGGGALIAGLILTLLPPGSRGRLF
ncbi:hypothetical protein [Nigerium massiliense]|uniref:hypothetical protein n=1 Tax=Nigerium massiliense TaxID=1522317 RepID=UPI00058EF0C2|nr:hypothetical protein [Nigerium massiliense]